MHKHRFVQAAQRDLELAHEIILRQGVMLVQNDSDHACRCLNSGKVKCRAARKVRVSVLAPNSRGSTYVYVCARVSVLYVLCMCGHSRGKCVFLRPVYAHTHARALPAALPTNHGDDEHIATHAKGPGP